MNFDGKIRQRTVSVAGLGRKSTSTTTNKEIIENARKKREQRQEDRTKQIASIKIQSIWRGVHTRSNIRNKFRQEFDSKLGGVQKIKALFQAQKKVFLVPSETLLSLLLLYHASHFLPNVSTTKARAIYLLGLLKESMDNESAESNVLSLLVDPNQGFLVASQIMSFIGTGLASLDLSSTSEEWSNFASALKHLFETNSLTSVTIQMVIRRLRMNILRAALLPLARSGVSHASALGFSTWAVNWISSDLAHSLKRPELWRVLLAGDASHSELVS